MLWVGVCPKCGVKNAFEVTDGKAICIICDPPYTFDVKTAKGTSYEVVGYWRGYCPKCGSFIFSAKLKLGEDVFIFCGECKAEFPMAEGREVKAIPWRGPHGEVEELPWQE